MRLDAKGGVKFAGAFPDGRNFSASGQAAYRPDDGCVYIPVCVSSKTGVLAGFVRLTADALTGRWGADGVFRWNTVDAADVSAGGSRMDVLLPVGGAYETGADVQTVLQADTLAARLVADGLMEDGLESGAVGIPFPDAFPVNVAKTGLSTENRRIRRGGDGWVDWGASENPFNFKLKLAQTSGVLRGSVDVWYWDAGATRQKRKAAKITGVLLQNREHDGVFGALMGAGTVYLPVSKGRLIPAGLLTVE